MVYVKKCKQKIFIEINTRINNYAIRQDKTPRLNISSFRSYKILVYKLKQYIYIFNGSLICFFSIGNKITMYATENINK